MKALSLLGYILLMQQLLFAQAYDKISIDFKNDVLFNKDKDYTAGVELAYKNKNSEFTYYFGQDIYTPEDKESLVPLNGEHPYGAWLYVGASKQIKLNEFINNDVKFTIGTVGKNAKGQSISNELHNIIGASSENGWDSQVHKTVGYNVNITSYFTQLNKEYKTIIFKPYSKINFGNLFIDIGVGLGINSEINDLFNIYVNGEIKYVDKNIFLEGKSKKYGSLYAVEKENHVNSLIVGLQMKYFENYILTFETIFNSKEYKTQKSNNNYNMIKVEKKF